MYPRRQGDVTAFVATSKHLGMGGNHGPERQGDVTAFVATSKSISSGTGTRTLGSCVKGKYVNHLHHTGAVVIVMSASTNIVINHSDHAVVSVSIEWYYT